MLLDFSLASLLVLYPLLGVPLRLLLHLTLERGQLLLVRLLLPLPLLIEAPRFRISVRSVSLGISRYFLHNRILFLLLLLHHLFELQLSLPLLLLNSLIIAFPVFSGFVGNGE